MVAFDGRGAYIKAIGPATAFAEDGAAIREWVAGVQQLHPEHAAAKSQHKQPHHKEHVVEEHTAEDIRQQNRPINRRLIFRKIGRQLLPMRWVAYAGKWIRTLISRSHFASAVGGWQANMARWAGQMGGAKPEPLVGPITDQWQTAALHGTFTGRDGIAQHDTTMLVAYRYHEAGPAQGATVWKVIGPRASVDSTDFKVRWQQVVFADQVSRLADRRAGGDSREFWEKMQHASVGVFMLAKNWQWS